MVDIPVNTSSIDSMMEVSDILCVCASHILFFGLARKKNMGGDVIIKRRGAGQIGDCGI
jgi:hypothetical protein